MDYDIKGASSRRDLVVPSPSHDPRHDQAQDAPQVPRSAATSQFQQTADAKEQQEALPSLIDSEGDVVFHSYHYQDAPYEGRSSPSAADGPPKDHIRNLSEPFSKSAIHLDPKAVTFLPVPSTSRARPGPSHKSHRVAASANLTNSNAAPPPGIGASWGRPTAPGRGGSEVFQFGMQPATPKACLFEDDAHFLPQRMLDSPPAAAATLSLPSEQ